MNNKKIIGVTVGTPIKPEVIFDKIDGFIKIVGELPEVGEDNKIYLVPKAESQTQDLFDEYLWINGTWEWITTKQVEVNLDEYVKNTDYATSDKAGVVKTGGGNETGISIKNGVLQLTGITDYVITHPRSYNVALRSCDIYKWFRTGITMNDIELTEEEKAAACEWLGAATKKYVDDAIAQLKAELQGS